MLTLARLAAAGLRARRGRALLAALGVAAAAIVIGTGVTVGYGLSTGFERAVAAADLPHVIARFDPEGRATVDERVRVLPNLAAREYRLEVNDVGLHARRRSTREGAVHVVLDRPADSAGAPRRGYAIVAGRDLGPAEREVVVEQGLARAWSLQPGDILHVGPFGHLRIAGIALSPDNVAFPLARAARVYLDEQEVRRRFGPGETAANLALLWLNDPGRVDVTLAQARVVSFGVGGLSFVTQDGIQVLLDQAGGVVIALLIAFSLVALVAAGTMLAANAHAEVQRRLAAFGVQRALGFPPRTIVGVQAVEAVMLALPAAATGLAIGTLAVAGPSSRLLAALNELPPGTAVLVPLAACLVGIVALFTSAACWPAWRAARRPPAETLRGGDLVTRGAGGARAGLPRGGLLGIGARFVLAARGRWLAAVATIGVCAGVVLLMLSLAGLLERLRDDPATLGKRYQLTARLDPARLDEVRAIPGVVAASERYAVAVADSFRLGESLTLVAFGADHTRFEAPPLAEGRRLRGPREVEVGVGLADVLGLRPGSVMAVQVPSGAELRFRVAGLVRALENDGRMAYARPDRLIAAEPGLTPAIAIRLAPGVDRQRVRERLRELGTAPATVGGATTRNAAFLGVLAAVLRGVGLAVGLVCLYALVQALAMTARERRGAVALLRAAGADGRSLALVFAGAALVVTAPAAVLGVVLELAVFGPLVSRLAAGFAALPLAASVGQILLLAAGLLLLAGLATLVVARDALRIPIAAGLRRE